MKNCSAWCAIAAALIVLFIAAPDAFAGTPKDINVEFYDEILERYKSAAKGWRSVITNAASWLFWTLAVISMVWTFGMMALRKADIGEFFAEFVRFTIFTGFFWWLLINGPDFAESIIYSLAQLGAMAGGLPYTPGQIGLEPSGVVKMGFEIYGKIVDNLSRWPNKIAESFMGGLMGLGILSMLCLIGINMLLLIVSAWIIAYAGIFLLGFGGSRWTSEMAINYYKCVLGMAIQVLAMVLLIAVGKTFLDQYYETLKADLTDTNLKSMGSLLMACGVFFVLISRIPPFLAGIITGISTNGGSMATAENLVMGGGAGKAQAFGGAAEVGAAASATAAGGAQALMAAFSKAIKNASGGGDDGGGGSSLGGGLGGLGGLGGDDGGGGLGDDGGGGEADEAGAGDTPFAQAAGFRAGDGGGKSDGGKTASAGGAQSSGGGESGGGFMDNAAKAGRITADAGGILAKGAGSVAKNSAMDRIAKTTGGKMAAAIKASGAGGGDGWINQSGGFSALPKAAKAQAIKSHTEWQAKSKDNTLGVEDYVSYAQERNAEIADFVNKKA